TRRRRHRVRGTLVRTVRAPDGLTRLQLSPLPRLIFSPSPLKSFSAISRYHASKTVRRIDQRKSQKLHQRECQPSRLPLECTSRADNPFGSMRLGTTVSSSVRR